MPSFSLQGLWDNELQSVLAAVSEGDAAQSVVARFTNYEMYVGGAVVSPGVPCTSWQSFLLGDIVAYDLLYGVASVDLSVTNALSEDGRTFENRSFSCSHQQNASLLLMALYDEAVGSGDVWCGGHHWVVDSCGLDGSKAVCVGCEDPCSPSKFCSAYGSSNEGDRDWQSLSPCVEIACESGNPFHLEHQSSLRLVSVSFKEVQAAPEFVQLNTSATKSTVAVSALFSAASGVVNCGVFGVSSAAPLSTDVILLQNHGAAIENNRSTLTITGLSASTPYVLYCFSTADSGAVMSLSSVLDTKTIVRTDCCLSLQVALTASNYYQQRNVLNAVRISLSGAPSDSLTMKLNVLSVVGNETIPVAGSLFLPAELQVTRRSYSVGENLFASLKASPLIGDFRLSVEVGGASRGDFEVVFTRGDTFSLISTSTEPPTPRFQSATFSSDGSALLLSFDGPTDQGGLSRFFRCDRMFSFRGASSCVCQWVDASTTQAFASGDQFVAVGEAVRLISGISGSQVRALCTADDTSPCRSWSLVSSGSVVVEAPADPVTPVASLSAPSFIGVCDRLTLDMSASSGSGGRDWSSVNFQVSSSDGNVSALSFFLNNQYRANPPSPIPARLLKTRVSYKFSLELCNFLGQCGRTSLRVAVLSTVIPSVSILGPPLRTVTRRNTFSLSSDAFVASCDGTRSRLGLLYRWSVSAEGVLASEVSSQSRDPSRFRLSPFSLSTGVLYEFTLTVNSAQSLRSSSSSVQVYVEPAEIIAVVAGGSLFSVRPLESLLLDGSGSYDEDAAEGEEANLVYSWSCLQVSPTLNETCPLLFQGGTDNTAVLELYAPTSAVDRVVEISLVVRDATLERSAQQAVTVSVVEGIVPRLSLSSSLLQKKFNPAAKLFLSGSVNIPRDEDGQVPSIGARTVWSVDDDSLDLSAVSLLPVERAFVGPIQLSLALKPNSLIAGSTLTFNLFCELENGRSSTASITIETNAPPRPGSFEVSPAVGVELEQEFTFVASRWLDEDLPLSYQFGIVLQATETGRQSVLVTQARSESPFSLSTLPAGDSGGGYMLLSSLQVFDVLSANTSTSFPVTVNPLTADNSSRVLELLSSSLQVDGATVDEIRSAAALASSVLNAANCSLAPNCTALHRWSCAATDHTCGGCLAGFVGDDVDSNDPCIPIVEYQQLVKSYSEAQETNTLDLWSCESDGDCTEYPLHVCGSASVCEFKNKTCSYDCSGRGNCYFSNSDSGVELPSCAVGRTDCSATCDCDEGVFGSACAVNETEFLSRLRVRQMIAESLTAVIGLEDPSEQAVSAWTAGLVVMSRRVDELSRSAAARASNLTELILANAMSVGMSYEGVAGLMDVMETVTAAQASAVRRRRRLEGRGATRRMAQEVDVDNLGGVLTQYGDFVAGTMVDGQEAVQAVRSNYRISVHAVSAFTSSTVGTQANDSSVVRLENPLSELEVAQGQSSSAVSFAVSNFTENDDDGASVFKLITLQLSAGLFGNSEFQSNPLEVFFQAGLPCAVEVGSSAAPLCMAQVEVVLQNNAALNFSSDLSPPLNFTAECAEGISESLFFDCGDGGLAEVRCNGTAEVVRVECGEQTKTSVCNAVVGNTGVSGGCSVLEFTSSFTRCSCLIQGPSVLSSTATARRRLQPSSEVTNGTYLSTTGAVNFVAMLNFLTDDFVRTVVSAQELNGGAVTSRDGVRVLVTLGIFVALVLLLSLWGHWADAKARNKSRRVDAAKKSAVEVIRRNWVRHSQGGVGQQRSEKKLSLKEVRRLQMVPDRREKELSYLERSLPNVLRSKPFRQRFMEEVRHFHRWFGVVFYYSENFPRLLRIISLTTNISIILFVQAATYNLTNPDDGSCAAATTREACLEEDSAYATGEKKCVWGGSGSDSSCSFNAPEDSLKVVLFVAVFAAMISAPLAIFCDWLIMNVLAAPSSRRRRLGRKSTRRSGQPSEKRKSDHITTLSADQESAGDSRQGTGGRRRFSVANFLGVGLTSRLRTTLQEDLSNLLRGLCAYRLTLTSNQQKELNDLWGLKDNGHFLTDADWEEGELGLLSRPRQWLSRATGGQRDVQQAITNDLRQVRKNLDEEIQLLKGRLDSDTERGRRLLFLFQRDLLPGINGEILEAKNSRDVLPLQAVDAKLKLMALIFICILNAAMLFFVYLFAFNQTTARQGAWLQSFLVWLVMEVLLVSTVVVYFTHFLLPSFIMRDVSKIKHRLLDSIHDYNDQVQNTHKEGSTGIPLDQQQGPLHLEATGTPSSAEDSFSDIRRAESVSVSQDQNQESDEALFNAAEFLFTSYRVAKEFPLLRESQIILRFSTPWPPQSYRRVKDVSQSYRKSLSAVTRSGSMVLIFLVGGLLQFPGAIQDVFIQMIGSVLIGYVVLIHIQLYETFPPLVALPGFLILVFLHYLLYFYQGQHRVQMTKILPIQQTLEKCEPDASQDEEEIHSVQEPSQQAGEMCENEVNSDTSGHDDDVADFNTVLPLGSYSGSLKIRPAQAESGKEKYDFVSLRQSILQGKAFIREMENFNRNQALAMGASKDLKKDDYGK